MRYCMGLVSGMRILSEQPLDKRQRLALVPGALAEHPVAHTPLRIDHERHRQASDLPVLRDFHVPVEQHRRPELLALQALRDLLPPLAELPPPPFQWLSLHPLLYGPLP